MSGLYYTTATLMVIAGVALLYSSWTQKKRSAPRVIVGWAVIAASIVPWSFVGGIDRGTAFLFISLAFSGFVTVFWVNRNQPAKNTHRQNRESSGRETELLSWREYGRRFYLFLLAGPVSLAASIMLTICLSAFFQHYVSPQTELAIVFTIFPFLWAVLLITCLYDMPLKNRSIITFTSLLAGYGGLQTIGAGAL